MARITCWDGVGCIGGNKILLEDSGTAIWLDFGLDFGKMGTYYEEYLKPKTCLGLYEPMQMGLIPPIKVLYREDLISDLADPFHGISAMDTADPGGVLLSHAHLDHLGALHYVRKDIPIYSSAVTLAIAKATEDTGAGTPDEYCYTVQYEPCDTGELGCQKDFRKRPSKSRPYAFVNETPSPELMTFWNMTPSAFSQYGRPHEPTEIAVTSTCGGLNVRRFPVDHSIYGACAWAIETQSGWVVYSGDIRCHGFNRDSTWKFAEEVSKLKPIALIIEGTRIESEGTNTEDQVLNRALDEVKKASGLVVADFGPRNVERLISFLRIARETGRKLVLLPKDVYLLEKMALAGGEVPPISDESILIYSKYEGSSFNWRKDLKQRYADKMIRPDQVAGNQSSMICCFSFFDANELAYIRPVEGSMWLFSSCEAFNEEMQIDAGRLSAWVRRYGMAFPGDPTQKKSPFHVSGHACRTDLLKVIEMINPKAVIPVHTERPDLYAEMLAGKFKTILPERGKPIEI